MPDFKLYVCCMGALLLVLANVADAASIITLGSSQPTPGPADQYQTNFVALAQSPPPGGGAFNYYLNASPSPGQTFTTGSNPSGYALNSLALYDADNTGGGFGAETFTLGIYSVSGSTATLITTYTSQTVSLTDFTWFQWTNLVSPVLQPNTQYAYAMWANGSGWCNLGSTNVAYAGGQVAIIPRSGGPMTFSSSSPWSADFVVGLTPLAGVSVGAVTLSPGAYVVPGTTVTASAPVNGPGPYTFQWQTDGGSGGALTNISGAASSNLVINTTGYANGFYQYDVVAGNGSSSATGQVAVLQISTPIGIPGVIAVKFAFTNGYATTDDVLPADNTGPATGQLVPPSNVPLTAVGNWNNLRADVVGAGSQSAAINQTWTIAQDTTGAALPGVTLTPSGWNDGWFSGGTECPAGRLLYDCWKINQNGNSPQFDGGGRLYGALTFNNLPWSKYDVMVFVNDNNGNYWGNMQANNVVAQGGSNVDDSSHGFNGASSDPCGLTPPLHTFGSYNGGNSANSCNYVKLQNVAAVSGAITISVASFGGGDMGVSGVELVPAVDLNLVQDVTPDYVEAMTGESLGLSVSFSNAPPASFQWFKISGGATNTVSSGVSVSTNNNVVTSVLQLNSLQSSDSASYVAKVSNSGNSGDYTYSSAATVVVTNTPAPVNNVVLHEGAQVSDYNAAYYPTNWLVNTNTDLIYGFALGNGSPGTVLSVNGNFGADGSSADETILTDGILGNTKNSLVVGGPAGGWNTNSVYSLNTNVALNGFDLTNITVYGGWPDGGRRDQAYQVLYSTVANPAQFIPIFTTEYVPNDPNGGPIASRTQLVPVGGKLAHNVAEVMINWDVPQLLNGYSFYSEIEVNGTPSTAPYATTPANITSAVFSAGNLILKGSGGAPSNANYTLLSTTNLTAPINWVESANGQLDGTGAFSNSIPINPGQNTVFFRWTSP